jgi:geranylgeranyl pyrophosphate synthase/uncharacterized protein with NAD-binding domain and iron-sulfur cluster
VRVNTMKQAHVLVLGAGVGGLTAAHELIERGCRVTVLEASDQPGGKSRSIPKLGSGRDGRRELPGEHGFRFFPGFYRHLPETLRKIPYGSQPGGVFDNLRIAPKTQALTVGRGSFTAPNRMPTNGEELSTLAQFMYQLVARSGIDVPQRDVWFFVERMLVALTSCDERREREYEYVPFWEFADAPRRSEAYQRYCVEGLTRTLVACKAREISTRTGVNIGGQLIFDALRSTSDRVLCGPTNDVWFDPWMAELERLGVEVRYRTRARALRMEGARVAAVDVVGPEGAETLAPDAVVCALPVERMLELVNEDMLREAPEFARMARLKTEWMAGVVLFLDRALPLVHGHCTYLDAPWALTSVAQEQFWPAVDLSKYGDGQVRGVLSVCVSDWERPGIVHGRPARECTHEQIRDEVIAQVAAHLPPQARAAFRDARVIDVFIDPAIRPGPSGALVNDTPLLVNTVGSWEWRPDAATSIENLVLASDYVRTHTDLATMEGANEAAKRAVNALIERLSLGGERCAIYPLSEPAMLGPLKELDRERYARGEPHALPRAFSNVRSLADVALSGVSMLDPLLRVGVRAMFDAGLDRVVADVRDRVIAVGSAAADAWKSPGVARSATSVERAAPGADMLRVMIPHTEEFAYAYEGLVAQMERHLGVVDQELLHTVGEFHVGAVRHAALQLVERPGKRVRATTALLVASLSNRAPRDSSIAVAMAGELVHVASLLHDDIIDDAPLRRGAPTAHASFGTSVGLLSGNLLATRATSVLLDATRPDLAGTLVRVVHEMIRAESEQLEAKRSPIADEERYFRVIRGKTAALFRWICESAARAAGLSAPEVSALAEYGDALGLVFQLVDDALDFDGASDSLGKESLADLREGKWTYPLVVAVERDAALRRDVERVVTAETPAPNMDALLRAVRETGAVEATRARARAESDRAERALDALPWSVSRYALQSLARWNVSRLY